jgi:hypothetical protein
MPEGAGAGGGYPRGEKQRGGQRADTPADDPYAPRADAQAPLELWCVAVRLRRLQAVSVDDPGRANLGGVWECAESAATAL